MKPSLIKIIDALGRTVKSILPSSNARIISIDAANLGVGTYTVVLYDKETIIHTERIIKQ